MQKLTLILAILVLVPIATALVGNDSSGNEIRFETGYITINSTTGNITTQAFGDELSSIFKGTTERGWLSRLDYNIGPPNTPSSLTPTNNSFTNLTIVTFEWANATDPENLDVSYYFELYNDSALTLINNINKTIIERTITNHTLALADGTYYWRVLANDSDYNSSFTDLFVLTIDAIFPSKFNLTEPLNATSSTDNTPFLSWDSPTESNIQNYTLEFSPNKSFDNPQYSFTSTTNTFSDWNSIELASGDWYWQGRVTDKSNNQNSSETMFLYTVEAITTTTTTTTTTTVSTGGGGSTKPFTISIIEPPEISLFKNDQVTIPLIIKNPSSVILSGITLEVESDTDLITTTLETSTISSLSSGEQVPINLIINTGDLSTGVYGITIRAKVDSPLLEDTARIFTNLIERNAETTDSVNTQLNYAKTLLAGNPECLDLSEFLDQAALALANGEFDKAKSLADGAISACNELISSDFSVTPTGLIVKTQSQLEKLFEGNTAIIIVEILALALISFLIFRHFRKPKIEVKTKKYYNSNRKVFK